MRVSGFSVACNAVRLGYPIEASLRSLLPLVDELILNIGEGDDETWDLVAAMHEPTIKPFRSKWDFSIRQGGVVVAQQTNLALARCTGRWALYLQIDEVLHEQDYDTIRAAMRDRLHDATEVLRFRFYHFYGSFQTVQDHPVRWYPRAARAVKMGIGVESWGDAMDFCVRRRGRQFFPRNADIPAYIYHYGWVRPPAVMTAKRDNHDRIYYDDGGIERIREERKQRGEDIYCHLGNLRYFRGTHPAAASAIVARQNWAFDHGIERQPPDWLRHSWVWALYYGRRWLHMGEGLRNRIVRKALQWKKE